MRVGSLFSGIGGLDLGLERAGMSVAWQCEIDAYCRGVLAHHWPGVPCYPDVRTLLADADSGDDQPRPLTRPALREEAEREGADRDAGGSSGLSGGGLGTPAWVDLICGGFPCQPVSLAGKGLAQEDPRWLWPEFARVVGLLRPRYVLVENVPGLVRRGLADVVGDLAALGYDSEWQIVSAASVGAPHLRERLIVVAYPARDGLLADSSGVGGAAWRERGLLAGAAGATEEDGEQRERCRDAADGGGAALADPGSPRRREDTRSPHAHEGDQDGVAAQDHHVADGHGEGGRAGEVPRALADAGRGAQALEDADGQPRLQWRPPVAREAEGGRPWPDATGRGVRGIGEWFPEPEVGRVAHGVPGRVAQLRALGNAVVPQVAEFVGRLILEAEAASDAARA